MKLPSKSSHTATPKVSRAAPETASEAAEYDKRVSRYRRAGFCDACAGQAAWGGQLGFSNVRPPCPTCTGLTPPAGTGVRAAAWAGEPTADTTPTDHPQRPPSNPTGGCGGCDQRWTGMAPCHCSACHLTWSGITLFDRHRRGGACLTPDEVITQGQELIHRDGIWRQPEMSDEEKLARFGDRTAS